METGYEHKCSIMKHKTYQWDNNAQDGQPLLTPFGFLSILPMKIIYGMNPTMKLKIQMPMMLTCWKLFLISKVDGRKG